jgi:hypothetical protein
MRNANARERKLLIEAFRRWRGPVLANGLVKKHHAMPWMFDLDQLAIGIAIEMEHTSRPEVAMEISMAHLIEDRDYYVKLVRMERGHRRPTRVG